MKKKRKKSATFFLTVLFLAGLSLLLYPSIANYWNSLHQTREITDYVEAVSAIDEELYDELYEKACAYNSKLPDRPNPYVITDSEKEEYQSLLNVTGTGVMGYIDIPTIEVTLPIYHGTADSVLQIGVGHLEWTSLPSGGLSTHCVLSGHRGLPSAKLFTNLDRLVEKDVFILRILDEILTYEIDQILIVEPGDTKDLEIVEGKDYCTLVTCTPYGINTHRLLVRGHRIANEESAASVRITPDAVQVEELVVAPILGVPLLILILIFVSIDPGGKKRNYEE